MGDDRDADLRGWLPVDAVVVDGRPGVRWMDLSGLDLAEPLFAQTVARAVRERRAERFTEFDALLRFDQQCDGVEPTGFIFHASRCGSTRVANACRAVEGAIVLSEAPAIDKLIARFVTDADDPVKDAIYAVCLRAVVRALAQRRAGGERHLFVKFAACSAAQLERIRRIWPGVPWLFLYRDPVEIIVSNMADVPPWLVDDDRRVLASITRTTAAAVAEMSLEERCARTIGRLYAIAGEQVASHGLLLDYARLSMPALAGVLAFFGVGLSADQRAAIARTSGVHAKDATGSRPFVADAGRKQAQASDLVREMSERWAAGPYRRLEASRQPCLPGA